LQGIDSEDKQRDQEFELLIAEDSFKWGLPHSVAVEEELRIRDNRIDIDAL
jgi:hypothetical protein